METMENTLCPCGSGLTLEACCGPVFEDQSKAQTAEALMRARYSAHALGKYEFLEQSTHPEFREESSPEEIKEWSSLMDWQKLEILRTVNGGPDDEVGEVDFRALYQIKGMPQELRENGFFRKENGVWYYVEGTVETPKPVRRAEPKVGRNDPCPCGSGKKYKKCCLGAA